MSRRLNIKKLKVSSFKSIVDQDINLGQLNVFIGANGSGKSNILEAIGIVSAAASGRVDDESLQRRGVRPGVPRLYKSSFNERHNVHVAFEVSSQDAKYAVSLHNPLEKPRPSWLYKTESLHSGSTKVFGRGPRDSRSYNPEQGLAALKIAEIKIQDPSVELINTLRNYAIYCPNTPALRGGPDPQSRVPVGLSGGRLAEAVRELQLLQDWDDIFEDIIELIDWAESISVSSYSSAILSASVPRQKFVIKFVDRFMRRNSNTLTASDASEGALYVLFCAIIALLPSIPNCVAIDNIDQALNPRLAKMLVRKICDWISSGKCRRQILCTAHNPSTLDGLDLRNSDVKLFSVDRDSNGHTVVREVIIDDRLLELNREQGLSLSNMWVMGHLGGVPNV